MQVLQASKIVRITKDIKGYYQQLLAVDQSLLRALVDAFELKVLPPVFSQLLSNDEEDGNHFSFFKLRALTHKEEEVLKKEKFLSVSFEKLNFAHKNIYTIGYGAVISLEP